jgi:hypothetical protein
MEDFEEAIQNIDIFCRIVVEKMLENTNETPNETQTITPAIESMENLLRRKYIVEVNPEAKPSAKPLIPLPHLDDPLIDILEDDQFIKVLMQYRCKDQEVTIHKDPDGLQICTEKCRKINLPNKQLQIENMISKCNNNEIFEIDIPKTKP